MTSCNKVLVWISLQILFWWNGGVAMTIQNVYLKNKTFVSIQPSSLYECGATCLKTPSCLSINLVKSSLECQLNSGNSSTNCDDFETSPRTVFIDKTDLQKRYSVGMSSEVTLYSNCDARHNSSTYTYKANQKQRRCHLPYVPMGKVFISDSYLSWPIGAMLKFECHDYAIPTAGTLISCVGNNQWSMGGCKRPASCAELQVCNHSYGDGDYWLYPDIVGGERVKLFCSNMNTTQPKEYVSLAVENTGIYPNKHTVDCKTERNGTCSSKMHPGTTVYRKIRLNIKTMEVNRWEIAFGTLEGAPLAYAEAFDCYTQHVNGTPNCGGPRGTFNVDLRGTGFAVHSSVTWKAVGNNMYMIVKASPDRSLILLTCGGWEGGCEPVGPFILDFLSNEDVPYDSATEPTCKKITILHQFFKIH